MPPSILATGVVVDSANSLYMESGGAQARYDQWPDFGKAVRFTATELEVLPSPVQLRNGDNFAIMAFAGSKCTCRYAQVTSFTTSYPLWPTFGEVIVNGGGKYGTCALPSCFFVSSPFSRPLKPSSLVEGSTVEVLRQPSWLTIAYNGTVVRKGDGTLHAEGCHYFLPTSTFVRTAVDEPGVAFFSWPRKVTS